MRGVRLHVSQDQTCKYTRVLLKGFKKSNTDSNR